MEVFIDQFGYVNMMWHKEINAGYFAWLLWSTVHLISISGFRNKLLVGLNWAWSYFTYDKGNRLIIRRYKTATSNEEVDVNMG